MAEEVVVVSGKKEKVKKEEKEKKAEVKEKKEEEELLRPIVEKYERISPRVIKAVLRFPVLGEGIEGLCKFIDECITEWLGIPQFIVTVAGLRQPWVIARCWGSVVKAPGGPIIDVPETVRRHIEKIEDDWIFLWEGYCSKIMGKSIKDLVRERHEKLESLRMKLRYGLITL